MHTRKSILKAVGIAVLLPVLYVLSIGPAAYLDSHGWLSESARRGLTIFYKPLAWAEEHNDSVSVAVVDWIKFWIDLPP